MAKRAKAILTEIFCSIQIFIKAKGEHMREDEELVSLSMIVAITSNDAKDPFASQRPSYSSVGMINKRRC